MRIAYITRDNGACAYYRLILPIESCKWFGGAEVGKIEKGDSADYIFEHVSDCDILVIARPVEEMMHKLITMVQELGKKVVIDFDDDLWNVSPFSGHYKDWGTKDVVVETANGPLELWIDGKNIDLKANEAKMTWVAKACETADLVTVTQPELAKVYEQFGKVRCLPNCINMELWQKLPLKRSNPDEVRLYWSGGSSHYEDWTLLKDALPIIMQKYPQTTLTLFGMRFTGTIKNLPQDRVTYHPWVPTPAYPYKTAILDADISLIPLVENDFNKGKSNIKWVEQATLGVPNITSYVTPYKEWYNGKNGVFVNNDTASWVDAISKLVEDPLLRANIAGEARKTVQEHFDISHKYKLWLDTYQELIDGN